MGNMVLKILIHEKQRDVIFIKENEKKTLILVGKPRNKEYKWNSYQPKTVRSFENATWFLLKFSLSRVTVKNETSVSSIATHNEVTLDMWLNPTQQKGLTVRTKTSSFSLFIQGSSLLSSTILKINTLKSFDFYEICMNTRQ